MPFTIVGDVDANRLYCAGSFTKCLTTYVCLNLLAETYDLSNILDNDNFFDTIATNPKSREFLDIFQKLIGSQFSIRDICSYYSGLPYTFDLTPQELANVEAGHPFKHHSIMDEETFLDRCRHYVTPVYNNRCKFHYSEIAIIFFAYFIEKAFNLTIDSLYKKYIIDKFQLTHSYFSRQQVPGVYVQDLSDKYDYPAIAITDHGYFCYSNGYFTTLNDEKKLLEGMVKTSVFHYMTDIKCARAASNRLMNGLTIELRLVSDDVICGYEGLSYSGCNIFAYSLKQQRGFLTISDDEDAVYPFLYGQFGYTDFDKAPAHTQEIYQHFLANLTDTIEHRAIPAEYVGDYLRVKMNSQELQEHFHVTSNTIVIRNPEMVTYEVVYARGCYRILCKDGTWGQKVGFYQAESGNRYMMFDGNLYRESRPQA